MVYVYDSSKQDSSIMWEITLQSWLVLELMGQSADGSETYTIVRSSFNFKLSYSEYPILIKHRGIVLDCSCGEQLHYVRVETATTFGMSRPELVKSSSCVGLKRRVSAEGPGFLLCALPISSNRTSCGM